LDCYYGNCTSRGLDWGIRGDVSDNPILDLDDIPGTGPENINIHSIRLPGLLAHQEIIFGSPGQIYTLRHDTTDRACYMPGVLLGIRKVINLKTLVYGLEKLL
jgi:dihydrodipicolinate reductase